MKYFDENHPCEKPFDGPQPGFIRKPLEHVANLPTDFIWNNVEGVNYLTNKRN